MRYILIQCDTLKNIR